MGALKPWHLLVVLVGLIALVGVGGLVTLLVVSLTRRKPHPPPAPDAQPGTDSSL